MRSISSTRLLAVLAVALAGVVLAGCVNEATSTTLPTEPTSTLVEPAEPTTTAPPPTTTTTSTTTSTTTTVPASSTTTTEPQPVEVPPEAREVLEAQSHEVVVDFVDRLNRADDRKGYVPLEPSDPFDGAARDALEVTEALYEWTTYCYEVDWCKEGQQWDPAGIGLRGSRETLIRAGEGEIYAYSDGTFYVEGLYSSPIGRLTNYLYFTGFRFAVEDGQAVLLDAAGRAGFLKEGISYWLSALDESSSEVVAVPVAEGVSTEVVDVLPKRAATSMLAVVELSNSSDEAVWAYTEDTEISGNYAEEYNAAIPESFANDTARPGGWSLGFGRKVEPGESTLVLVNFRVLDPQKGTGTFSLPVYDRLTGTSQDTADILFTLDVTPERLSPCEVFLFGDDFLRNRECLRPPPTDHTWSG